MTQIDHGFKEKHEGSTRAKVSYSIDKDGDNVKVSISFSVRKSGVSGTGYGAMAFALIGDDGGTVFHKEKGFSVGADAIRGKNEKTYEETFTIFGDKWEKVVGAALKLDGTTDSIGVSPGAIIEGIAPFLGGLGTGIEGELAGWIIKRLK
ncbi:hypothetical protein ASG65_20805 [Bacillus sp. Leaf13]|nr:hypothetical protein ASG65_20805 [Bacillus sp. Leaf13]